MRCYFLRDNKIEAVYLLAGGSDDDLVHQARHIFDKFAGPEIQGFEVWEGRRFIYRYPERDAEGPSSTTLK